MGEMDLQGVQQDVEGPLKPLATPQSDQHRVLVALRMCGGPHS